MIDITSSEGPLFPLQVKKVKETICKFVLRFFCTKRSCFSSLSFITTNDRFMTTERAILGWNP